MRNLALWCIAVIMAAALLAGTRMQIAITTFRLKGQAPHRTFRVTFPGRVPPHSISSSGSVVTEVYDRYGFRHLETRSAAID